MIWASPLAWLLAVGALAPLAAHLLSRRPPVRRPFPTLRFVRATATSARRLRTLHDPWLLALRAAIVCLIAGAAAGPTWVSSARTGALASPLLSALVLAPGIDDTPSNTPAPDAGSDEQVWRYAAHSVRQSVAAAVHALQHHDDRRRRIVVRWGGDVEEWSPEDVAEIPAAIGVTLEPSRSAAQTVTGTLHLHHAEEDAAVADRLRALADWGAGDVTLVWPGADARAAMISTAVPASGRTLDLWRRMQHDARLVHASRRSSADPRLTDASPATSATRARFVPLAPSADGDVLLWGAEDGEGRPLLVLDARPRDPLALWTVRVAQDAARGRDGWPRPSRQWTAAELQAHTRPPATPSTDSPPGGLDTRWWWLAALVLLAAEQGLRRSRRSDTATTSVPADEASDAA